MRHARQVVLDEIGEKGQETITNSHVLIVGLGALGSTVAELLCRAGVARLTFCDYDIIQEDNLQRQSLYTTADIGRLKVEAAAAHVEAIDPSCTVSMITEPFSENVSLDSVNLIVDGTDSLHARLLVNDAAKKKNTPCVFGTAAGTRGFAFTGCWQCITLGKKATDSCDDGVIGSATHAIASLQVAMAIRTLLDDPNKDLVELDVWTGASRKITVPKNPACKACAGSYEYLNAPFEVQFCEATDRLQARPNKPKAIDLTTLANVLEEFPTARRVKVGKGTALVHKHGTIEFENVTKEEASAFVRSIK
ncbi:MAG: HesA/MoeB/ThiF family protein [Candidatus Woesearchaeota archaeon]|nr:HesA/MoeB/ThiF family protein [Candidatus Woesearchaeota archaeon]